MAKTAQRGPGRPPLPRGVKKIRKLTFRARGDLADRLAKHADDSGRSVSEEIESQLTRILDRDDTISALLGGPRIAGFMRMLSAALTSIERRSGKKYNEDAFTAELMKSVAYRLIHMTFTAWDQPALDKDQEARVDKEAEVIFGSIVRALGEVGGTLPPSA